MKKTNDNTALEMVPVRKITRRVNIDALKFSLHGPKLQNVTTNLGKSNESDDKQSPLIFDSELKVDKTIQWPHNMYYTIEEHMTHQV